jgi:hypothetical protein
VCVQAEVVAGARAMGHYIAAVYDYVLMTEPLDEARMAATGWTGRQGIDAGADQFHYCRLSGGGRILFGGYEAVYRYGGPVADRHRWGGAIDTRGRFSVCFGSALIQLIRNRLAAADRRQGTAGAGGSARSIVSGSGSTAGATAAGSVAMLGVTGGASRTGDVTAGGEDRN